MRKFWNIFPFVKVIIPLNEKKSLIYANYGRSNSKDWGANCSCIQGSASSSELGYGNKTELSLSSQ